MALSKPQIELLEYCHIPLEVQRYVALELGEEGIPKNAASPDFLKILCNLLQIYEVRLESLRYKLGKSINIDGKQPIIAEPPLPLASLEDEVKIAWTRAAALWKATDLVVSNPAMFSVILTPEHVEFSLDKKNLPVVEMIRYAKPEFFAIKPVSKFMKVCIAFLGVVMGSICGLIAGVKGGIKQVDRLPNFMRAVSLFFYAIGGLFSGSAMGAIAGGSMGLQTGNLPAALKLAYDAAYLNPFHDPIGSKYQRAVQLQREQILFKLAHDYSVEKNNMAEFGTGNATP